jgi:hypothetical protein
MFHFPTFPPSALCVQAMVAGLSSSWVSPFGNPRITARLPTPRGLSQAPTSFFGSWCQGIHHVLLVACRHKDARVHCVVLNMRAGPTRCHADRKDPAVRGLGGPRGCRVPDPSGPNSVPDELRLSPGGSTPAEAGCTDQVTDEAGQVIDVPLSEHHRVGRSSDERCSGWVDTHQKCSLERR